MVLVCLPLENLQAFSAGAGAPPAGAGNGGAGAAAGSGGGGAGSPELDAARPTSTPTTLGVIVGAHTGPDGGV